MLQSICSYVMDFFMLVVIVDIDNKERSMDA